MAKVRPEQAGSLAFTEVVLDRLDKARALGNLRRDAGNNLACARKCRVEPPRCIGKQRIGRLILAGLDVGRS
jgi:hypothetical protein